MSTRQLRKLQKQRELETKTVQESKGNDVNDGDAGDDEVAPIVAKPRVNLFAALAGEEADGEAEGDDDAEESKEQGQVVKAPDTDAAVEESAAPATSRRNKKKKKKSKKAKAAAPTQDVELSMDDEIDRAIKELKIEPRSREGSVPGSASAYNSLLKINPYNLKAVHEMRNLFGRDTIESANAEEEEQRRGAHRGVIPQQVDLETFLRGPTNARKLPEVSRRRNVFIQGREHWPLSTTGGLSMKELGKTPDGTGVEYAYAHDQEYDGVQTMFFAQVQMGDPMRMVQLLGQFPYHVSTLLQVSSVAKQDQNMALAAELCERALFSFGRVAPSSFRQSLEQGTARLDFRRPENRQFWLSGYHYIKSLVRKGTYKTALEWTKLLYSLDRSDPYAMRHLIHFLAIRAHESNWLLDFLNQLDAEGGRGDTIYLLQSRVLASLQIGDAKKARQDLTDGMQRIPWLYCALFQELNLDTPPSVWGINAETDTSAFWVKLYLYQTKDLWNNPQAATLLQDVAKSIGRVDAKSLPKDNLPIDLGVARLAYIDGQTSLLALVPRHILEQQPNYEFDPLPPAEKDNIFTGEGCRLPWHEQRQSQGQRNPGRLDGIIAQMEEFLARRGTPPPVDGEDELMEQLRNGAFHPGPEADDYAEEDEELGQNTAGEVPVGSEDRGMIRALIQLFGFGGARAADTETRESETAGEEGDDDDSEEGDHSEENAELPGGQPAEERQRDSGRQ
ncbi:transcriptional repressor TCF25 domain-containing protein [Trichoderma ceciliae]